MDKSTSLGVGWYRGPVLSQPVCTHHDAETSFALEYASACRSAPGNDARSEPFEALCSQTDNSQYIRAMSMWDPTAQKHSPQLVAHKPDMSIERLYSQFHGLRELKTESSYYSQQALCF
jgi:hypothetical protein